MKNGTQIFAESQPGQLLRGDGAGRVHDFQRGPRHRFQQRSTLAGTELLLQRHPAQPSGQSEFPRDSHQPLRLSFSNNQRDAHMRITASLRVFFLLGALRAAQVNLESLTDHSTFLYTPPVINTPKPAVVGQWCKTGGRAKTAEYRPWFYN
jgi:hypothetical protein